MQLHTAVIQVRSDLPTIVQYCTKYSEPTWGGKHKSSSPYCDEHTITNEDNGSGIKSRNDVDNDVQLISKFDQHFIGELSKNDDSVLVGCKKPENRTKYYLTTAGLLALIRSCGIVISMTEMFTCESPTQEFLFLLRTFVHDTDSVLRLRSLGYGRDCDLKPCLVNQAKKAVLVLFYCWKE